ncbi:uncharacterized protein [Argopecten irradians]|uniref:uncharacterized protein n=1 Tax=Argopecten irradians TaxID=31199 RepID=UPI00371CF3E9
MSARMSLRSRSHRTLFGIAVMAALEAMPQLFSVPRGVRKRVNVDAAAGSDIQLMAKRMKALEEQVADVKRASSGVGKQPNANANGEYEYIDNSDFVDMTDPLGLLNNEQSVVDFDDIYSDILPTEQDATEDLFAIPDYIYGDAKVGPSVHEGLARLVNTACRKASDVTKMAEKYPTPANCGDMTVPRCNPEIWGKIGRPLQARDFQLKEAQKSVSDGMVPVMKLTEALMNHADFREKFRPLCIDALSMLGNAVQMLSVRRRYFMRQALPTSYQALCGKDMPITSNLFGDDLAKRVRDISESNRAFNVLSSRKQVQRGGWNGQRGRGGYNGQFRGSGRPFLRSGQASGVEVNGDPPVYNRARTKTRVRAKRKNSSQV